MNQGIVVDLDRSFYLLMGCGSKPVRGGVYGARFVASCGTCGGSGNPRGGHAFVRPAACCHGLAVAGTRPPATGRQRESTVRFRNARCVRRAGRISEEANGAIRLVIQHASPVDIERYLPMVEKAAAKGTIEMADDASAFDRMRMHDKLPQHYGSQTFAADPNGRGGLAALAGRRCGTARFAACGGRVDADRGISGGGRGGMRTTGALGPDENGG